jgi:hypothetical protein
MGFTFKENLIIKATSWEYRARLLKRRQSIEEEDEIGEFISEMCFDYGRSNRKPLTKKALKGDLTKRRPTRRAPTVFAFAFLGANHKPLINS